MAATPSTVMSLTTFVHLLTNVLNRFYELAKFDIYVCFKCLGEKWRKWNNPMNINFNVLLIHIDYSWPSIVISGSVSIKWIVIISSNSYYFEHFLATIHRELWFNILHGQWLIFFVTTSCTSRSSSLTGISAVYHFIDYIPSYPFNQPNEDICTRQSTFLPLYWIHPTATPNTRCLTIKSTNDFNIHLNILVVMW